MQMRFSLFSFVFALSCVVGMGLAEPMVEVISDQIEPVNLSFPQGELKRFLATRDAYACFKDGFFHRGFGMPAPGSFDIMLDGRAQGLRADYVLAGESVGDEVVFSLSGDDKELWRSPVVRSGDAKAKVEVSLADVRKLTFRVESAGGKKCSHACWGNLVLTCPKGY